ncbi:MAG: FKBP-type peptidyl-prolyl cis-trans isomerase [Muribaculaceae bacterium]|nr:FKBP-type peptidyl-prolyl cis-trans isomerase [Muribaculaceae bacterium]
MKKFFAIAMAVVLTLSGISCNKKGGSASSSALTDSLSMAFGDLYGNGMGGQIKQDSTLDTKSVLRGMEMVLKADTANHGLMTGIQVGMNIMQMYQGIKAQYGIDINQELFLEHFKKAFLSDSTMPQDKLMELQTTIEPLLKRASAEAKEKDPKAIENKKAGEAFINKKAKEAGYQKTASGVLYKVIKEGNGANFTEADEVMMNYKGMHIDGKEFDKSEEPVPFRMQGMIKGFAEVMKLMKPGMKVEAIIPGDLAYGPDGMGDIGPNETLVFEMEAVGLAPKTDSKTAPVKVQPVKK